MFSHSSHRGGAELSFLSLVKSLVKKGLLCNILLPSEGYLAEKFRKMPVSVSIKNIPRWDYEGESEKLSKYRDICSSLPYLINEISNVGSDVIYSNTQVFPQGAIIAEILKIPHIWHIREFGEKDYGFKFLLDFKDRANFIYNYSDKIIFNSLSLKKYFDKEIKDDKSEVVYNYVELPKIINSSAKFFKNENSLKLLLVGVINEGKGQLKALEAVSYCIEKYGDNLELVFLGNVFSEKYYKKLNFFIKNNSLEKNASFHAFIDNPTSAYKSADIILMCSDKEAFGRVTVESYLMKRPVIGESSGATSEIVIDGETGLLFKPGNIFDFGEKIHYFYLNRDKISEFGEKGFSVVKEKFSDDKYSGKIYKFIRDINFKNKNRAEIFGEKNILLEIGSINKNIEKSYSKNIIESISDLNNKNKELELRILFLESSKFWKLRDIYLKIKHYLIFIFLNPRKFIKNFIIKK
jgi:glycosyltransferase involved in cell wall biosynthesis